jgi:hypothetical protein
MNQLWLQTFRESALLVVTAIQLCFAYKELASGRSSIFNIFTWREDKIPRPKIPLTWAGFFT